MRLCFDITVGPDYRLYHHSGTDTIIITPNFPPDQAADDRRLAMVRKMVADRGVARRERLERLLNNPSSTSHPATIKTSTVRITHEISAEVKA